MKSHYFNCRSTFKDALDEIIIIIIIIHPNFNFQKLFLGADCIYS